MKKIQLILICLITATIMLPAQTIKIDSSEISFENKLRPCWKIQYDADAKEVKKGFATWLKKKHGVKIKGIGLFTDKDIVSAKDVTISDISDKRMNLYARVTDIADGSEMKYFMAYGYDFFIGPEKYPVAFEGMKKLLHQFSFDFLNDYYKGEASRILKKIKTYEKDFAKNNKTIGKNSRKADKGSSSESSALEAKNYALKNENVQIEERIKSLQQTLESIKEKQKGLTI